MMLQIAELAQIRMNRLNETGEKLPQAQDGLPTILPPGSELPTFLGFQQAAEEATGTTRYDPRKHKMTPDKFRAGVAEITKKGIADGLSQAEIIKSIDSFQGLAGYTDRELNPRLIEGDDVKLDNYNTQMVNPFPALKLILGLGGSLGGTLGGAKLGARLGLFGGPAGAVAGSIVGGTLGYLSGLVGYEKLLDNLNEKKMLYTPTYNEIGEFLGYEQGISRPDAETFKEYLQHEAKIDLAFGAGFGFFRPAVNLLRPIGRRYVLGVGAKETKEAKEIQRLTGITPSVFDVSRYKLIRAIPNALGRMPIYGAGVQRAFEETQTQFIKAAKNIFMDGPTYNLASLGIDLSKVRDSVSKTIIGNVNKKYTNFFNAIGNKQMIDYSDVINEAKKQKAFIDELTMGSPNSPILQSDMYKTLQNLATLQTNMATGAAWKVNRSLVNDQVYQYGIKPRAGDIPELRDALFEVSKKMEKALGKHANGIPNGDEIKRLLNVADQAYSDMVTLFATPSAKALGADSKFAFQALIKTPGNVESDRLFNVVFQDFRSPKAVESMRRLMGDEMFAKGVKAKLLGAFEDSFSFTKGEKPGILDFDIKAFENFDNLTFNATKFKRILGLDEIGKSLETRGTALSQALSIAGKRIKLPDSNKLLAFANAAEVFFNGKNLNVSQYLARRTMLGGSKAFTTAILPIAGAGFAGAMAPGIGLTLLGILVARKLGYLLASPMALDSATKAMNASAKAALNPLKMPTFKGPFLGKGGITGYNTVEAALPISERYALETIETLYKQFPELPGELDNEFNAIQARTDGNDMTASEFYLKSQESLNNLGTMSAVDEFLNQKYDNRGVIRPTIFGSGTDQAEQPAAVNPASTIIEEQKTADAPVNVAANVPAGAGNPVGNINQSSRLALLDDDPLGKAIAMRGQT